MDGAGHILSATGLGRVEDGKTARKPKITRHEETREGKVLGLLVE